MAWITADCNYADRRYHAASEVLSMRGAIRESHLLLRSIDNLDKILAGGL